MAKTNFVVFSFKVLVVHLKENATSNLNCMPSVDVYTCTWHCILSDFNPITIQWHLRNVVRAKLYDIQKLGLLFANWFQKMYHYYTGILFILDIKFCRMLFCKHNYFFYEIYEINAFISSWVSVMNASLYPKICNTNNNNYMYNQVYKRWVFFFFFFFFTNLLSNIETRL